MAKRKSKKIVRFSSGFHINVGMIVFFLIFIYMSFYVYAYIRRDKVQFYEVEAGGIVNDKSYSGLILRQEELQYTDRAGTINYYVREGKRVSVGSRVYSLDETGSLSSFLSENPDAVGQIAEDDLADLKRQLSSFSLAYDPADFSSVADTKSSLEASVMEYMNFNSLENLDEVLANAGIHFQQVRSGKAGIVSYAIDGFSSSLAALTNRSDRTETSVKVETSLSSAESSDVSTESSDDSDEGNSRASDGSGSSDGTEGGDSSAETASKEAAAASLEEAENERAAALAQAELLNNMTLYSNISPSSLTEEYFDKTKYVRNITKSGEMISSGIPAYKLITSEDWSIVFQLTDEEAAEYRERTSLDISLIGRDLTITGDFSIVTGADGKPYGKLDFNKYVVLFASERFVNFEILSEEVKGLKIPVSAVTSKDFFLVPVEYLSQGGDSSQTGFMKEIYSEQGTASVQFVPADIYYSTEEYYYIDKSDSSQLKAGDYLVKPGSATERFQLGPTASLQGAYNINKGYAVFRQIEVLTSNDEYYTVEKGTRYGLSVYDHIVLNAATVQEGELIYQ